MSRSASVPDSIHLPPPPLSILRKQTAVAADIAMSGPTDEVQFIPEPTAVQADAAARKPPRADRASFEDEKISQDGSRGPQG